MSDGMSLELVGNGEYNQTLLPKPLSLMIKEPEYDANVVMAELIRLLRTGSTIKGACDMVGLTDKTFYKWTQQSTDFNIAVRRAMGEFKQDCEQHVILAMNNHWQAGAWWLERRHSDEYGEKGKLEIVLQDAYNKFTETVTGVVLEYVDPKFHKEVLARLQKESF